ncbi:MAG: hypothetical protein ACRDYA_19125 [Egibacteraceae bacterium]
MARRRDPPLREHRGARLAAKPVIDILAGVRGPGGDRTAERLALPTRALREWSLWFRKPRRARRTHHLDSPSRPIRSALAW